MPRGRFKQTTHAEPLPFKNRTVRPEFGARTDYSIRVISPGSGSSVRG